MNNKNFWPQFLAQQEQEREARRIAEENTRRAKQAAMEEALRVNHIRKFQNHQLFLETEGLYRYDPDGAITSQQLYTLYKDWCLREKLPLFTPRKFWQHVKEIAPRYQLRYCGQIRDSRGKYVRGFRGIRPLLPEEMAKSEP